jgi:putative PIN family toxin of toxin-antitoxin system
MSLSQLFCGRARPIVFCESAISWPLLEELVKTLSKSKLEKKIDASLYSIDQLVDLYSKDVTVVRPFPVPRLAPAPDDDVVIGTAITAKADFIVTGDKPLLSVKVFEGGRIVSVSEALEAINQSASRNKQ